MGVEAAEVVQLTMTAADPTEALQWQVCIEEAKKRCAETRSEMLLRPCLQDLTSAFDEKFAVARDQDEIVSKMRTLDTVRRKLRAAELPRTIIDDATKRLGGPADNRCRVTVTDRFGGRGHDYQVAYAHA